MLSPLPRNSGGEGNSPVLAAGINAAGEAAKPIKIAIAALGGQGGGVLAEWIVALGERRGFIAQSTSVPGVAQRTGATIYYVELFPLMEAIERGKAPVLALMPTSGDVDIVIASELMEAGRAMTRGFVSKATTMIASTHRDYAVVEKIAPGDGRRDGERVIAAARRSAGRALFADMAVEAQAVNAPLSAVLFGALCGSGALAIDKADFEAVIREGGKAVARNLAGFKRGYEAGSGNRESGIGQDRAARAPESRVQSPDPRLSEFPPQAHYFLAEGLRRVADYQDERYAALYLDRMARVLAADRAAGGERRDWRLTAEAARYLALAMTYEDAIRVADLKTRAGRFARFREDVKAAPGQIVEVFEYMHPRVEEACDLMPPALAAQFLKSGPIRGLLKTLLGEGRRVPTTRLRGFLQLYALSSLRVVRRASSRFKKEHERIEAFLARIMQEAAADYELGVETAGLQRLIKGYGDTHERGMRNVGRILAAMDLVRKSAAPAKALAELKAAALKDEEGAALGAALSRLAAAGPAAPVSVGNRALA
ncbi:MAG: indolepyruvate oxidoreductase subunit beta family protein [Parvularculaceae bacterium]